MQRCFVTTLDREAPQWRDMCEFDLVRRYQGHRPGGGWGRRGRSQVVHQTIGGLRAFRDRQQDSDRRRSECIECGEWGPSGEQCLECHEDKGYQLLHGLHGRLVGHPSRLIALQDLQAISEPLGALLLELPQRAC